MSSDPSPILPLELEREIFEEAASHWPETIPSLLLVSHRAYEWIEKIKYRTVTPNGEHSTCSFRALMRAIQSDSKTPSFFRTHIRHLYVPRAFRRNAYVTDEMLEAVLAACAGIQSLSFARGDIPAFILPTLAALRPRRLWMRNDSLVFKTDLSRPMFTFITHVALWLMFEHDIASWLSLLAMFPTLTHMMTIGPQTTFVPHILASSRKLEVLVTWSHNSGKKLDNVDDRYVNITRIRDDVEQWVMGARGGNDFWALAEDFIAKKRCREIQPDWRYWIEDADGI
ncbi:hypothetical protein C8F04DRAFT_1391410 [Mycena alexandri]|uniref:Uncharacterized protein n=1 Tax=Mycena alexandri TaxID=1745969 RepID=A0AAD6T9I8_9AGAR|nr:hypothetical protein C8F04DRAFT_1391410 [Mycena alexandri]